MSDLEDFDFDNWVKELELIPASVKILKQQHLDNYKALMETEKHDIAKIGLAVGQEARVRGGIRALGNVRFKEALPNDKQQSTPTSDEGSITTDDAATGDKSPMGDLTSQEADLLLKAGKDLDVLLGQPGGITSCNLGADPRKEPGSFSLQDTLPKTDVYDPRQLLTLKATTRKAEKIASFLPERVKDRIRRNKRDQFVLAEGNAGNFTVQQREDDHLAITSNEWGAANMRLLNHLLSSGQLKRSEVEFYLAYTMQIFEYADLYEWPSVVKFDCRYRELQAEYNFCWGDMRLAHQLNVLVPRQQQQGKQRLHKPLAKTEPCKKWLLSGGKSCPFGDNCRFLHKKMEDATSKNGQA